MQCGHGSKIPRRCAGQVPALLLGAMLAAQLLLLVMTALPPAGYGGGDQHRGTEARRRASGRQNLATGRAAADAARLQTATAADAAQQQRSQPYAAVRLPPEVAPRWRALLGRLANLPPDCRQAWVRQAVSSGTARSSSRDTHHPTSTNTNAHSKLEPEERPLLTDATGAFTILPHMDALLRPAGSPLKSGSPDSAAGDDDPAAAAARDLYPHQRLPNPKLKLAGPLSSSLSIDRTPPSPGECPVDGRPAASTTDADILHARQVLVQHQARAAAWRAGSEQRRELTLATQSTLDHYALLLRTRQLWAGPISSAVLVLEPLLPALAFMHSLLHKCLPPDAPPLATHLVQPLALANHTSAASAHEPALDPATAASLVRALAVTAGGAGSALYHALQADPTVQSWIGAQLGAAWALLQAPPDMLCAFPAATLQRLGGLQDTANYDRSALPYPNNMLRNMAREHAGSRWIFVVDVDMVPGPAALHASARRLLEQLDRGGGGGGGVSVPAGADPSRVVLVVPGW